MTKRMTDSGPTWWVLVPLYAKPKAHLFLPQRRLRRDEVKSACGRPAYESEWAFRQPENLGLLSSRVKVYPRCKTCLKLAGRKEMMKAAGAKRA